MNQNLPVMTNLHRRRWLAGAAGWAAIAALPTALQAATVAAPVVAVPYYNTETLLQTLRRHWYLPAAGVFRQRSEALLQTLSGTCSAASHTAARAAWIETLAAWTRLSAVAVGPLLQRSSQRAIDFQPPRPRLIDQAIDTLKASASPTPPDAARMERIGSPAKGLPALELLLWGPAYGQAITADAATCAYAAGLAADLVHEARALEAAWQAEDAAEPDEAAQTAAFSEFVNQWLGAVEALRWRDIERPLRAGQADKTGYPRQLSGQTARAWRSQWEAVRALTLSPATPPAVTDGQVAGLVPMALYLRGQGQIKVSDALDAATRQADAAMQSLRPQDSAAKLQNATRALATLKQRIETDAARAAQVNIGFTDADGD